VEHRTAEEIEAVLRENERLERENAALRRILIDKELENEALRQLSRGTW
jgi:hypothetical protein